MVVNKKKNIKQSLFELGIQLFLGTRSGFLTALCHCCTDSSLVTLLYRCRVTYLDPSTDRCISPYCRQAGKMGVYRFFERCKNSREKQNGTYIRQTVTHLITESILCYTHRPGLQYDAVIIYKPLLPTVSSLIQESFFISQISH